MNVYKNDLDETVRFRIEPHIGTEGIYLELKENGNRATTVFPPKDAPALALAILEAAGYREERKRGWDVLNSADENIAQAMRYLSKGIEIQKRTTADAKEQAELEAEALELCDSARLANGRFKIGNFGLMKDAEKTTWLAVARRAREMRAEK